MRTLVDYRPALRSRTGVGEYVHELSRALVRTAEIGPRRELALFSSSWSDRLAPDAVPGADVVDCRWPVRILNYTWHRWSWPPAETLAEGLGMAVSAPTNTQFDVVQSMHPLLMPTRRAAQVVTVHDLDFLDHPERTRAEVRRDYRELSQAHAQAADHVVTVSEFTAGEVVRRLGVPRDRISICSPGAPDWTPRDSEPANGYVLFLGTLEPRKNLGALLDAYAMLCAAGGPLPRLVVAGRAVEGSEQWVAKAQSAPLAGRVELRGYVAPEDRRALMAGAMALVMPSFLEGFGIPALEAMTLGVPVIVSNRGSLPEVVGDAGLVFDANAPAELAAALHRVFDDGNLRRGMTERGLERAKNYSWDRSAALTREAWRRAVEQRRRA